MVSFETGGASVQSAPVSSDRASKTKLPCERNIFCLAPVFPIDPQLLTPNRLPTRTRRHTNFHFWKRASSCSGQTNHISIAL
ncbi:hypothetical protein PHMEG_00015641 [Phytophthora megakarya]|uniref:Uncharacterized protein n=1 Tax=Phytophthora megakarya TaxID=4795 RepID=A0A225W0X0_9STRA|nr:hypothetical protein PHMEG_00015641 [Phytophthora megakarya]